VKSGDGSRGHVRLASDVFGRAASAMCLAVIQLQATSLSSLQRFCSGNCWAEHMGHRLWGWCLQCGSPVAAAAHEAETSPQKRLASVEGFSALYGQRGKCCHKSNCRGFAQSPVLKTRFSCSVGCFALLRLGLAAQAVVALPEVSFATNAPCRGHPLAGVFCPWSHQTKFSSEPCPGPASRSC